MQTDATATLFVPGQLVRVADDRLSMSPTYLAVVIASHISYATSAALFVCPADEQADKDQGLLVSLAGQSFRALPARMHRLSPDHVRVSSLPSPESLARLPVVQINELIHAFCRSLWPFAGQSCGPASGLVRHGGIYRYRGFLPYDALAPADAPVLCVSSPDSEGNFAALSLHTAREKNLRSSRTVLVEGDRNLYFAKVTRLYTCHASQIASPCEGVMQKQQMAEVAQQICGQFDADLFKANKKVFAAAKAAARAAASLSTLVA